MQQFVLAPDRRYRVELHDDDLQSLSTGGQADTQWLARGAVGVLAPKIEKQLESASRKDLLLWGSVTAIVSTVLLIGWVMGVLSSPVPLTLGKLAGIAVPAFGLLLGSVMILSGLLNQAGNGHRHNFSLSLYQITAATLLPVQSELARRGEPQAARVQLALASGKKIILSIPTQSDLAMLNQAIPLGAQS